MAAQVISSARLARLLRGWAQGEGPLHARLATSIEQLVRRNELPLGTRLPSERGLAPYLMVSRTTVLSAYRALRERDVLTSRQGSGTWVARQALAGKGFMDVLPAEDRLQTFLQPGLPGIDFTSAAMPGLPLVARIAAELDSDDLLPFVARHGYLPHGIPELRLAVAQHLEAMGLPTDAEEILITSGAQQALQLLVSALIEPGDEVAVEDPTYRGALLAFTARGARLRCMATDESGVRPEALTSQLLDEAVRVVYLLPSVHNPTGSIMSEERRQLLADLVGRSSAFVIDDLSCAETSTAGDCPPPLAAYTRSDSIVTIGSLSKLYWGGIRVGWIRSSIDVIAKLARAKGLADYGSSVPSQVIALKLLAHHDEARAQRVTELRKGLDRLTTGLAEWLPDWRWQEPSGGGSLWVRLPSGRSTEFTQVALQCGIGVSPGPLFSAREHFEEYVRLPYVADDDTIDLAVRRLSLAWSGYVDGGRFTIEDPRLFV